MKRITTIALAGLALATLPATIATPAHAGDDRVEACHATGSATNPYVSISSNTNSFIKSGHGDHENDIHDAFNYLTKSGNPVTVPGKNWSTVVANGWTGRDIFLNGCVVPNPADIVVNPVTPVVTADPTCIDPNGVIDVPAQPEGVTHEPPAWDAAASTWSVTFSTADTPTQGYVFPDGTKSATWTQTVTAPDPADCLLPEVGFNTHALPIIGGGLLLVGGTVVAYSVASRRRNSQ